MISYRLLLISLALIVALPTYATAKWLLFDLKGDVRLTNGGMTTTLNPAKHLLTEIAAGSSLQTGAKGQVVLVSMVTSDAYEIDANTSVAVAETTLKPSQGKISLRKGYALPKKKSNLMAGVVMRGDPSAACLRILRGANTSLHSLTPTLRWQNQCNDSPVRISLFAERGLLLEQESSKDEMIVPAGLLEHGQRYVWLIETANRDQAAAASFNVLPEDQAAKAACLLNGPCSPHRDFSGQLSTIFALTELNLHDLANERLAALAAEYPGTDLTNVLGR